MTDDSIAGQENLDGSAEVKSAEEKTSHSQDDVVPKKYVSDIVKRERLEAYHKGKKDAAAELQQDRDVVRQGMAPQQAQANSGIGGMPQLNEQQIQQMIASAAQQLEEKRHKELQDEQQTQAAYQVAQRFNSAMSQGKQKYSDFDEKVKDLDFSQMSPIVHLATETGIPEDIMYDLADNPQKITHLMILAHTQPALAKREMDKLAASIKMNDAAKKQSLPNAPLSQITPSKAVNDSGEMSVKDYQKMFSGMAY